jgi:hypothetical protein
MATVDVVHDCGHFEADRSGGDSFGIDRHFRC